MQGARVDGQRLVVDLGAYGPRQQPQPSGKAVMLSLLLHMCRHMDAQQPEPHTKRVISLLEDAFSKSLAADLEGRPASVLAAIDSSNDMLYSFDPCVGDGVPKSRRERRLYVQQHAVDGGKLGNVLQWVDGPLGIDGIQVRG